MAAKNEAPVKSGKLSNRLQVLILVLALCLLMAISVATTLMATGVIDIMPKGNGPVRSMTDAQLICNGEMEAEHGDRLQAFALDDLSSREDEQRGGYKLFYEITLYRGGGKGNGVDTYFVNCFVSATGRVRRLDFLEQRQYVPKPIRRTTGNPIGL